MIRRKKMNMNFEHTISKTTKRHVSLKI